MSSNTLFFLLYIANMAWVAAVIGVTTYIVFWLGFSGWWYAMAVFVLALGPGDLEVKK